MKRLAIIGSTDLAQLIAYHASADKHYEVVGFYDDFKSKDEIIDGIRVLGQLNAIEDDFRNNKFDVLMVGIGYKHIEFRKDIFEKFRNLIPFGKIIHSSCYVDKSAIVMDGCFLLPGCVIDRNVILHENVLLNTACVIAHDSTVLKHSFLSPAVKMAGFSTIGGCCVIGINTTIIDNIIIGDYVQTGGGAVITKNIDAKGLYVGIPAKIKNRL